MKLFDRLSISQESNEARQNKETEVAIYAKIGNPNGLQEAASHEQHEQLEGKFAKGPKCRVRKTTKDNKDTYVFTFKVKGESAEETVTANKEFNVEVDNDFFEGFKTSVAEKFVLKTRYIFNSENVELTFNQDDEKKNITIPNILYEVDVYKKPDGSLSEWCKIDVEVDNILNFLDKEYPELKDVKLNIKISHLPFRPEEAILGSTEDEDKKAFLSDLWDNEFNHKV
jgi:hypothetical protein